MYQILYLKTKNKINQEKTGTTNRRSMMRSQIRLKKGLTSEGASNKLEGEQREISTLS